MWGDHDLNPPSDPAPYYYEDADAWDNPDDLLDDEEDEE